MSAWDLILRFIKNNTAILILPILVAILASAWFIFEAARGSKKRDEVSRLRRRVSELERSGALGGAPVFADPVVLTNRWLNIGAAATTSDGGCLLYIDRILPPGNAAVVTVRVDGYALLLNHMVRAGERLEASGKNGTYILELSGIQAGQAKVGVALRSRHRDA